MRHERTRGFQVLLGRLSLWRLKMAIKKNNKNASLDVKLEAKISEYKASKPRPTRVPPYPEDGVPSWMRHLLPSFIVNPLRGRIAMDRALFDDMVDGMWEGDEPMDRVIEWMFEVGPRQGKMQFDQALEKGIDSIDDPDGPLLDFFRLIDNPPAWVDMDEVDYGATVCNMVGGAAPSYMRDIALMGGYVFAGLNPPLVLTGALNSSASKRFAETFSYGVDTWTVGGMTRFGVGFKSATRIRMIHALVRRNLQRKPEWSFEKWGLPINQTDMLSSYLGPATFAVGARVQGVPITKREEKAVIHHAALAGWLLGVKEEWLVHDTRGVQKMMIHSLATQPLGDDNSKIMARSLVDEPLYREFTHFQQLQRKWHHHKHLSISSFYLPKTVTRDLGINTTIPWVPLVTIPSRFVWHTAHRLLPGGKKRLAAKGFEKQKSQSEIFAKYSKSAAALVDTDTLHPAHIA